MQPKEDFISQPLSHPSGTPKLQKQWVRESNNVIQEDFNDLWIINKLFIFDEWIQISQLLEDRFQVKVIINLLFVDKAIIKLIQGRRCIQALEKCQDYGRFHQFFFLNETIFFISNKISKYKRYIY